MRTPLGIPSLYQRITSSTPTSLLLATRVRHTSLSILHLDGTSDWLIAQRTALLAWTGHSLNFTPYVRGSLPLAHWGATKVQGRGLVALAAQGEVYKLRLEKGEEMVLRPGSVLAYEAGVGPRAFRFRGGIKVQVPQFISSAFQRLGVVLEIKKSHGYQVLARFASSVRTVLRRTLWGDGLFLRFEGPATVLMTSRAARIQDVLTDRDVDEIADAPEGAAQRAVGAAERGLSVKEAETEDGNKDIKLVEQGVRGMHVVTVKRDGKAVFEDVKDLKGFA